MTTKTHSSSKVEEFPTELEQKMEAFLKSEAFRKILSTAVNVAVEMAIKCFKNEFVELIDSRIDVLEDMNKHLQEDLNELNRRLNKVQNKANDNEQYSRRNNLRIYGIAEKQIENCYDEVTKFCNEELGVSIERNEIDRAHRVGKPSDTNSRAIIVKLKSYHTKLSIMKNKAKLRGKPLFINEDLTRANQQLLMHCKDKCRDSASVYTIDGYILAKRKTDGQIFRIGRKEDLVNIYSDR